jgi:hypothetical protein
MMIQILLLLFCLYRLYSLRVLAFFKYVDLFSFFRRLRMRYLLFFVLRMQLRIVPLYPGSFDDYAVFEGG